MHLVHSHDEPPLNLAGPLEASAVHLPKLVNALIATHFAFEGWQPVEPSPQLRHVYGPAAALAVRYASTPCRTVAENAAKAYGELRLDNLTGNIALQPERRQEFVQDFVRDVLRVYVHGLTVGTGLLPDEEGTL